MPLWAIIFVTVAVVGCTAFVSNGIRALRRRKRNLEHYERGEPLEGAGDWD